MNASTVTYLEHALVPQSRATKTFCRQTLAELAPRWERPFIALVDGQAVLRADWDIVLYEGHVVAFVDVRSIPQGGGGGSNPLRIIATLAVIALSVAVGGAGIFAAGGALAGWGSAASAAVLFGGAMLVNLALPPETVSLSGQQATASPSPTYSLQAQGNYARLEQAIPEHFGRHLAYPDFAAQPYSEAHGNEVYLYQLFCVGRGSYDIEAVRIEDTPVQNFQEISYEIVGPNQPVNLFPANVVTADEVSGQELDTGVWIGPFTANSEGTQARFIGVDFLAPKGLFYANDDGSLAVRSVQVQVQGRRIDDNGNPVGDWQLLNPLATKVVSVAPVYLNRELDTSPPSWANRESEPFFTVLNPTLRYPTTQTIVEDWETYSGATNTPQRYSEKYVVGNPGRYEVRCKRLDAKDTSTRSGHDFQWAGLRAYLEGSNTFGDVTCIAMIMRATDQLSSQSSRKVNVIATRKLPVWNGSAWSAPVATRSIAWAAAYICKQMGKTDAQIDLASLVSLNNTWTQRGDTCDGRIDSFLTFSDALSKVLSAGRAKYFEQGGLVRFWRHQAQTMPVALFSARNIVKGSFSVEYVTPSEETADAVEVTYFDSNVWKQRRVKAALPGSAVAKPVRVESSFITTRQQAYEDGMYRAACNARQRKIIKFSTEMDGFIPSPGDLIIVQHDMPAWGQSGEVVAYDSGSRQITASEPLDWSGSGTHYVALRRADGSAWGPAQVTRIAGQDDKMVLSSAPDFTIYTGGQKERTHYSFGPGETWAQKAIVLTVRPRGMYQVEIEAVNEDPSIHTAEDGIVAPPVETSQIGNYVDAPKVSGLKAVMMPNDQTKMLISWQPAAWADHYLVEVANGGTNWTRVSEPLTASCIVDAIYGSATVVRVAAVGAIAGQWATVSYTDMVQSAWDVSLINLKLVPNKNMLDISWDALNDWNVAGYELRHGATWETGTVIVTSLMASKYSWQPTADGVVHIWLKALDIYGVKSISAAHAIVTIVEPVVTNLTARVIDNFVLLSWTAEQGTYAIERAEIRSGVDFETSVLVGDFKGTFATIFETTAGTYKYWVVLRDIAGLYGQEVGIYAEISQPPDYVLHDKRPLDLPSGSLTSAVLDRGVLYAPVNSTETFEEHFVDNYFESPQDQVDAGFPYFLQPGATTGQYVEVIDYGAVIDGTMISLDITRQTIVGDVMVTPTISYSLDGETWTDGSVGGYQAYAINFRYVKIALGFSTENNGFLVITDSMVRLDVKEKTITGTVDALASDVDGTVVDITGKFIDVQNIVMTVQGATPAFAVWDFLDIGNPDFFKVYVFDTSGERINGTVNYAVKGV